MLFLACAVAEKVLFGNGEDILPYSVMCRHTTDWTSLVVKEWCVGGTV